jgi:hypothetical protein
MHSCYMPHGTQDVSSVLVLRVSAAQNKYYCAQVVFTEEQESSSDTAAAVQQQQFPTYRLENHTRYTVYYAQVSMRSQELIFRTHIFQSVEQLRSGMIFSCHRSSSGTYTDGIGHSWSGMCTHVSY